jgi:hypothetical protein
MVTSGPFDNWWHAAYGLDVKIVSPPHALLILGMRGVSIGVLFLILSAMNRAAASAMNRAGAAASNGAAATAGPEAGSSFRSLRRLLLYLGGLTVGGQMFFLLEYTWDVELHTASAYIAMAIAVPVVLAMISQASRYKWAATSIASIYMLICMAELLILPLFPATPKLGPVYYPVTHMVPVKFPILMVAPAFALDLLWQRTRSWKLWQTALVSGAVFLAALLLVEWPFASFLMTKAAENRFFGSIYFDYGSTADSYDRLRRFVPSGGAVELSFGLLRAGLYAAVSAWLGLCFGRWMRTVQR